MENNININSDEIININNIIIDRFGGLKTPANNTIKEKLDSILSFDYLEDKSIKYKISRVFSLILQRHIFNDGNKRTAWIVLELLLKRHIMNNDYICYYYYIDEKIKLIIDIINNRLSSEKVEVLLFGEKTCRFNEKQLRVIHSCLDYMLYSNDFLDNIEFINYIGLDRKSLSNLNDQLNEILKD